MLLLKNEDKAKQLMNFLIYQWVNIKNNKTKYFFIKNNPNFVFFKLYHNQKDNTPYSAEIRNGLGIIVSKNVILKTNFRIHICTFFFRTYYLQFTIFD